MVASTPDIQVINPFSRIMSTNLGVHPLDPDANTNSNGWDGYVVHPLQWGDPRIVYSTNLKERTRVAYSYAQGVHISAKVYAYNGQGNDYAAISYVFRDDTGKPITDTIPDGGTILAPPRTYTNFPSFEAIHISDTSNTAHILISFIDPASPNLTVYEAYEITWIDNPVKKGWTLEFNPNPTATYSLDKNTVLTLPPNGAAIEYLWLTPLTADISYDILTKPILFQGMLVGNQNSGTAPNCVSTSVQFEHIVKTIDFDGTAFIETTPHSNIVTVTTPYTVDVATNTCVAGVSNDVDRAADIKAAMTIVGDLVKADYFGSRINTLTPVDIATMPNTTGITIVEDPTDALAPHIFIYTPVAYIATTKTYWSGNNLVTVYSDGNIAEFGVLVGNVDVTLGTPYDVYGKTTYTVGQHVQGGYVALNTGVLTAPPSNDWANLTGVSVLSVGQSGGNPALDTFQIWVEDSGSISDESLPWRGMNSYTSSLILASYVPDTTKIPNPANVQGEPPLPTLPAPATIGSNR